MTKQAIKKRLKSIKYQLLLGLTGVVIGVALTLNSKVSTQEAAVRLYVDEDDTADSVMHKVRITTGNDAWLLQKLLHYSGYQKRVQKGSYLITPETKVWQLFQNLYKGSQQPIRLRVREVRTSAQLAGNLADKLMLDSAYIATQLADTAFCKRWGYSPETVISLFLPNTYEVYWTTSLDKLMERMQKESKAFWTAKRLLQAQELGFSPIEVITLASIVDEETAYMPEKATIAGLYINRLRRQMPLQADPTVKFALQDFELRRIYHKHLAVDSPYNTYRNVGLPPGPIRIPSLSAIDAVLQARKHDFLYMCAKEDFSGAHNFATTYAEHQKNAARYAKALNERQVK